MIENLVLGEKTEQLMTKQVRCRRQAGQTFITIRGPELSFKEMSSYRRSVSTETIHKELYEEGHVFANLGVSANLTINLYGQEYLLLVRQDRPDFGDSVLKLVSGYVPTKYLHNPIQSLEEEVLIKNNQGQLMDLKRNSRIIQRPYFANKYDYSSESLNLIRSARYRVDGLEDCIRIDEQPITDNPTILHHAGTNSTQLIYSYHLIPEDIRRTQENNISSIDHTEDTFTAGKLITRFHPEGIVLIQLQNGALTDQAYTLQNQKLQQINPDKLSLSEAFAPRTNEGIVEQNNTPLKKAIN